MLKEKHEQKYFVEYCKLNNIICVHIPNGMYLGNISYKAAYMNMLKSNGLQPGFPDLLVLIQNKKYQMLFLEFKKAKGGKASEKQKNWIEWLNNNGYCAYIVNGCNDAVNVLKKFINNELT